LPLTPERVAKLREFGLSEYAARTYLALLDLGTSEARDISGISKVPASKIYRILEQLHEKGLVAILPEFPRKYAPIPFEEFLEKIHDEHRDAAAAIDGERAALADMFAVVGRLEGNDRGSFTVSRGRRNVIEKLGEICSGARGSLLVVASAGCLVRRAFLSDLLADAHRAGAEVRVLLPHGCEAVPPELTAVAEVRLAAVGSLADGSALVLSDRRRALVVHFLPDDGHAFDGNDTGVATDHTGVIAFLDALARGPWSEGKPVSLRREIPVSTSPPFRAEGDLRSASDRPEEGLGPPSARNGGLDEVEEHTGFHP
jgi:sugar-specific transcriptional regulator TrmB